MHWRNALYWGTYTKRAWVELEHDHANMAVVKTTLILDHVANKYTAIPPDPASG